MCSILNARQLPPFGGDTHFASMSAAYRTMSSGLQNMLRDLRAWHSDGSFVNSTDVGIKPKKEAFKYREKEKPFRAQFKKLFLKS